MTTTEPAAGVSNISMPLFLLLLATPMSALSGCSAHSADSHSSENKEEGGHGHEGHNHGSENSGPGHEGHNHGEEHGEEGKKFGLANLDEILSARCEHDTLQADCDECRYELGLVKVSSRVEQGLLRVEEAGKSDTATHTRLACETTWNQRDQVEVVTAAGGRVVQVRVRAGQSIESGDVVAVMRSEELGPAMAQYRAAAGRKEIAAARLQRVVKVQANLKAILTQLRAGQTSTSTQLDLSPLEAGQDKAVLVEAWASYIRAEQLFTRNTGKAKAALELIGGGKSKAEKSYSVGEWRGDLAAARADLRLARKNYDRANRLSQQGVAPQAELDVAQRDLGSANARYSAVVDAIRWEAEDLLVAAQAGLDSARAAFEGAVEEVVLRMGVEELEARQELAEAEDNLEVSKQRLTVLGLNPQKQETDKASDMRDTHGLLEIRAQASGQVVRVLAVPGKAMEQGQAVAVLAPPSAPWAWCSFPVRSLTSLLNLSLPASVSVGLPQTPDSSFKGQLTFVGPRPDVEGGPLMALIEIETGTVLRPGMYVEATLDNSLTTTLAIPASAVASDEGQYFVFARVREGMYIRNDIKLQSIDDTSATIIAGLEPGTFIVTKGVFFLKSDVLKEKMGAGCAD